MAGLRRLSGALLSALLLTITSTAEAGPIRTLLVGDSITRGRMSGPAGISWAELLTLVLGASHQIVNVAHGGTSSVYWAPSTPCPGFFCQSGDTLFGERAAPELPADVAVVLLGTNDANGYLLAEPTSPGAWEGYMRELLDGLFEGGVGSVLLMSPPDANLSAQATSLIAGYGARVESLCSELAGVRCGADLAAELDASAHFSDGNYHPNALGHLRIAELVNADLRDLQALPEPSTGAILALALVVASTAGRRSVIRGR